MEGEQTAAVQESSQDMNSLKQEALEQTTLPETRVGTDCSKEETDQTTKIGPLIDNPVAPEPNSGVSNPPIKDYDWIHFKLEKEAFYIKEFLALHPPNKLNKPILGIDEEKAEKGKETPSSKEEEKEEAPAQFLGKRMMLDLDSGFGSRGFAKVVNAIEERIHKFGKLGEDEDCIKRKQHNNDEYYEQDEFIDDPIDQFAPQTMEIPISRYEDFFIVKGNIDAFKKHKKFNERIAEVKQRNRDSKNKKNEETRKKREAMQMESVMKGGKKVSPPKEKTKSQPKVKSNPGTVLTKNKSKKAASKKVPDSAKPKASSPIISKQT